MSEFPFKGLKHRIVEIDIGESEKLKLKPKVKDAEALFAMGKGEGQVVGQKEVETLTGIMRTMIKRANPDADDEDIDDLIAMHYAQMLTEVYIIFGFTTREKVDKLLEEASKKKQ